MTKTSPASSWCADPRSTLVAEAVWPCRPDRRFTVQRFEAGEVSSAIVAIETLRGGSWEPSGRAFVLRPDVLPALRDTLQEAIHIARREGWLPRQAKEKHT